MEKELLTIVVPAYNAGEYIEQCLNSLVNQTIQNHKVIIVDDGSTDVKTAEISKKYAKLYPQMISYMWQENQMQGAARNHALPYVDTEYVGFLDSDDWLPPTYIETISREILYYQSEKIDLIFTLPTIYDNLSGMYVPWYDHDLLHQIFTTNNRITSASEDNRLYYLEPNACMRIYRMELLKVCNFRVFPEGVKWEDLFPHFYLLYYAKKCLGVMSTGFYYRTNTAHQTTAQTGKSRLDVIKVFDEILTFLHENNCEIAIKKSVISRLNIFAKWSLDVASSDIRIQLVNELNALYCKIPKNDIKQYISERKHYKKERIFIWLLRHKHFNKLLYNYLPADIFMGIVNRIRRLKWIR